MKTEKFGPYEFVIVDKHVRLNRSWTLKDYADLAFNLGVIVFGCIAAYFVYSFFLLNREAISEQLIICFFLTVCILLIYISFKRLFRILFSPRRDIIHLDRKAKVVNIRITHAKETQIPLDSLLHLEYGYQKDSIHPIFKNSYGPKPTPPSAIRVYARTKKKKRLPLLMIREPNLQYVSNSGLEKFMQALVERLGELLNIPAKFHRQISIDHYTGKEL